MLVGMGRPPVVAKPAVASVASKEGGTDGGSTPGGQSANPPPEGTLESTANQGSSKLLNTSKVRFLGGRTRGLVVRSVIDHE
jgi:hypothetical protein